jgi:hypothetical protein
MLASTGDCCFRRSEVGPLYSEGGVSDTSPCGVLSVRLFDLAAEAHERSDGPDEADRAVVERVVAERAGRDENIKT